MTKPDLDKTWMIYGVNGYTGRLCAEEALRRGLRPVVAGRNQERVSRAAKELGLTCRVFDLKNHDAAVEGLQGITAVLNCAGPFSATARPFLDACATAGVHYLDVTGEISVFEYVHHHSDRWKQAGIVALPGVGFDVVPTDCMAAMLKEALPEATHLRLAFKSKRGKLSPGTTKTMIESLSSGSAVRRNGVVVNTTAGACVAMIPYADQPVLSVAIPWGDVSTAFHSTGIPNIEVYTTIPKSQRGLLSWVNRFSFLFRLEVMQNLLKRLVERNVVGPDESERNRDTVNLYGDVADSSGHRLAMTMQTPNGYSLTFDAAVSSMERVLAGDIAPGAQTPSLAFGNTFVLGLKGVSHTPPA